MGTRFPLAPRGETLLGRGGACQVALPDPICSRVHARIYSDEERWAVADNKSRNGTYVNGQKVSEATLDDGHVIRIGTTELEFHESEEPPTAEDATYDGMAPVNTQTIVDERPVTSGGVDEASLDGLPNAEQVKELMLLYQLCIKLLGSGSPDELVQTALDLLKAWGTGHPGGIGTIHAGTALGALRRLEQLIQEAVVTVPRALISETIDLVAVLSGRGSTRRLAELGRVEGLSPDGDYRVRPATQPPEGEPA